MTAVASLTLSPWIQSHAELISILAWVATALALATALAAWRDVPSAAGGESADGNGQSARELSRGTAGVHRAIPWWRRPWFFLGCATLAAVLHRAPTFPLPSLQNPDEAQMTAGAITLWYRPVFWKSVDGTTTGPLSDLVLMWTWLFGVSPGLATVRFTGVVLSCGAFAFAWAALRRLANDAIARLAVLAGFLWVALVRHWEFVQYTSEQLPMFQLALGGWFIAVATTGPAPTVSRQRWAWAAAGFTLATLALAKLQSAPAAAALVLVGLLAHWHRAATRAEFVRTVLAFGAGVAVLVVAVGIHLWIWGLFAQFKFSYLDSNVAYASFGRLAVRDLIPAHLGLRSQSPQLGDFYHGLLAAAALALLASPWLRPGTRDRLFALAVLWLGALWSVLAPGRDSGHYQQYLLVPTVVLGGYSWWILCEFARERAPWRHAAWAVLAVLAAFSFVPVAWHQLSAEDARFRIVPAISYTDPIAAGLTAAKLTERGEAIVVWGWAPGIYVAAERPQGVRDGQTERQILHTALREAYRVRFLTDLQRNRPELFIDAVGGNHFAYNEPARGWAAHDTWPELAAYVKEHYTAVRESDGCRFFLRRDLAARAARLE